MIGVTAKDKIEYIIMLVKLFAMHYKLSYEQAYRYISMHKGIEFAEENYGIMHTLPFEDQVEGLVQYCHRNGGALV